MTRTRLGQIKIKHVPNQQRCRIEAASIRTANRKSEREYYVYAYAWRINISRFPVSPVVPSALRISPWPKCEKNAGTRYRPFANFLLSPRTVTTVFNRHRAYTVFTDVSQSQRFSNIFHIIIKCLPRGDERLYTLSCSTGTNTFRYLSCIMK